MLKIQILEENKFKTIPIEPDKFDVLKACPICNSSENQMTLCVVEGVTEHAWCTDCSHMYAKKRPSRDWLVSFYKSDFDQNERLKPLPGIGTLKSFKRKAVAAFDILSNRKETICEELISSIPNFCSPVLNKGDKVLDIGCGYGFSLAKFFDLGYQTFGIEGSKHRSEFVASKGIPCTNTPVEELQPETFGTKFDLVVSNHVLEHVADPNQFIESVKRVCDYDKYLCITVPNFFRDFLFHSFLTLIHLHCYTPKSLSLLLRKHGFLVRKVVIDFQIRILAQRVRAPDLAVAPFEEETISPEKLKKVILRNLWAANLTEDQLKKGGHYQVTWNVPNPEKFNYNRILDVPVEVKAEPVATSEFEKIKSQLRQAKMRRMSFFNVDFSGEILPINISYKNGPARSMWSGDW